MPVRNGADTISDALDSLSAQSFQNWEAVIVDDGSTDRTAEVVQARAESDPRFRLIRQEGSGVSAARNRAIAEARGDWLAFLDADDALDSRHLEVLTQAVLQNPQSGGAYGNWAYVSHEGNRVVYPFHDPAVDFYKLAKRCSFAIFCCLVKTSIVREVGGFDASLKTCEDWDLWQRVARTGAELICVPDTVAYYHLRKGSSSKDAVRLLSDSWVVLDRGYSRDARVPQPDTRFADGSPADDLEHMKWYLSVFSAGLLIGEGKSAEAVLSALPETGPFLHPPYVATSLFTSVPLARAQIFTEWMSFYEPVRREIETFLYEMERRTKSRGLAQATMDSLQRLIMDHSPEALPLSLGRIHGRAYELFEPFEDVSLPEGIERLVAKVETGGGFFSTVELPVVDGWVTGRVVRDAVAAGFAWRILRLYLEATVYPTLKMERKGRGWVVSRGRVNWRFDAKPSAESIHNTLGWTVMLQELFDFPNGRDADFYRSHLRIGAGGLLDARNVIPVVELSASIPEIHTDKSTEPIHLMIGGRHCGVVTLDADKGRIQSGRIRTAAIEALGFELCVLVVSEGILGQPPDKSCSLRKRLRQRAEKVNAEDSKGLRAIEPFESGILIERRYQNPGLAAVNRHCRLPVRALDWIKPIENVRNVPGDAPSFPQSIVYAPHLISQELPPLLNPEDSVSETPTVEYNRQYFEKLFASGRDPWKYAGDYEQTKYRQAMDLLPHTSFESVLELGCAEGMFTEQLAERAKHLIAADISKLALERAAQRCKANHIEFKQLDISKDPMPGNQNLIVCSEVLYYTGSVVALQDTLRRMSGALAPDGFLLMTHSKLAFEEWNRSGFNWPVGFGSKRIAKEAEGIDGLFLVKELSTPLYRIHLYQKNETGVRVEKRRTKEMGELSPTAASGVVKFGFWKTPLPEVPTSAHFPILMYHRVAPEGSEALRRYRVTPKQFENQLRYLAENGYRGLTLEQLGEFLRRRKPIPGNAVCLTFDDGYVDFYEYAWPLLKQYGFPATMFIVTDAAGKRNDWDADYNDPVELMDWDKIVELAKQGLHLGSHSASHPALTALNPDQIAEELLRSRTEMEMRLGIPVRTICYPYGSVDSVVEHLAAAGGYVYGVTTQDRLTGMSDSPLALPRVEVNGRHSLDEFIRRLSPSAE